MGLSITVHMSVLLGVVRESRAEASPQVHLRVGAPGSPGLGEGRRPSRGRGPGGSRRRGCRCRRAGRRRGRRGPASRCSRPSRVRCPGSPAAARRVSSRPAPRSRTTSPSASARHRAIRARPRDRGIGRSIGSREASVATSGNRWVSSPSGRATGLPSSAVSRPAMVRAAPTVTCWPSTARTAISLPSTWPGTRRPGRAATSGPSSGSRPSTSSTATGSQSASSRRRTRSTPAVVSRRSSRAKVASTNAVWPGSSWSPMSRRTVPVP